MGSSTSVRCSGCGYKTFLMLGGGRANHHIYAAWPVICKDCAAVTTANFERVPLVCKDCDGTNVVPVTDQNQWKGDGEIVERWGNLELRDRHYRCPRCGGFELRFEAGLMRWD